MSPGRVSEQAFCTPRGGRAAVTYPSCATQALPEVCVLIPFPVDGATCAPRPRHRASAGFTLIELMIVVAIVGILAAVALPSYLDYVRRGKLVDATNTLSAVRARMEQYYLDNRKYDGSGSPCASISNAGDFSFSCEYDATTYVITATGSGSVSEFSYTIDQDGAMATTGLPTTWGSATTGCWITRQGNSC